jgi:DNA-binding GntR family transcriptional regulator
MIDSIRKQLEIAILTGDLKPRERLVETELCARLNVKRFAVRKAIEVLDRKGLVEIIPHKGARVKDVSDRELEDSFLVRMNLEFLAAELLLKRITPRELAEMRKIQEDYAKAVATGDLQNMILKNEEFHETLYQATDNKFLYEFLEHVTNAVFSLRYNAYFMLGMAQRSVNDHETILQAIEERDLAKLKRILKESIINPRMILRSRKAGFRNVTRTQPALDKRASKPANGGGKKKPFLAPS